MSQSDLNPPSTVTCDGEPARNLGLDIWTTPSSCIPVLRKVTGAPLAENANLPEWGEAQEPGELACPFQREKDGVLFLPESTRFWCVENKWNVLAF